MKNFQNSNLWLSVIITTGTLMGVGLGAYISNEGDNSTVQANYDQCRTRTVTIEEGSCQQGTWSKWNLTSNPVYDHLVRKIVEPHSRIFVGTAGSKTIKYTDCGGGQAEGSVTIPSFTAEICEVEQQDLVDPETDVTTINEAPDCNGPECDIPPSF